jgi:osmotically-inducible protein OsmY
MKPDVELQRHVLEELDWEPSIDAAQIGVTAKEGVVTLTGHVPVYAQKHMAEEVTKRVHGVRAIANEIEVRPSSSSRRDDTDIAAAALHAVEWDAGVPHDRVHITVQEAWISLDGSVDFQFQKEAADRAVRHLMGVRGVSNTIQVQPGAGPEESDGGVQRRIADAFQRSATLSSQQISVERDGDTIILVGDVHSYSQREEAERTAWSAKGVRRVDNCLTITPWGSGPADEWGY